jgi:hypothetical protein
VRFGSACVVKEQGKQHHLLFSAVSCKNFMHKTNPRMHSL